MTFGIWFLLFVFIIVLVSDNGGFKMVFKKLKPLWSKPLKVAEAINTCDPNRNYLKLRDRRKRKGR